ncbi:HesB/YadR/YfhF family protein [Neobacillus vireti]|uniref:HesB/YadR/YfhF family protein n=1 Tax=Neobacillus vireti TaxID=220686 RepID=UPI002FFFB01C
MFISIDEKAALWFMREFEMKKPINIRLFPQYAGFGEKNKGFSLAFSAEQPENVGYTQEMNGITFYVEGNDIWFFEDTETYLSFNEVIEEIQINYKETSAIQ